MTQQPPAMTANELWSATKAVATDVAAIHAADVDAKSRFPIETVEALKKAKLLSAAVPKELGGGGCSMQELGAMCSTLAQACGSSAMVLAMHHIQVACIARHGLGSAFFRDYLRELVDKQYLLASMTSEVGTSGDTRSSICAVERAEGRFTLNKDATTGSYCAHADGILVTCRRAPDAPNSDQVLVLVRKGDYTLTQTTSWDTMGMRGTCSPGFRLESRGPEEQIVPGSFAESSAQTMVPYSHILWSSLWCGIATDAVARAATFVRAEARKKPGTVPPAAPKLADVTGQLQTMRHNWQMLAAEFDRMAAQPNGMEELLAIGWALKMNNLKISSSETAPQIVHKALQIIGVLGYKNDSKFSVARHYRDALSGALMISNDRIAAKSASMLLVFKDE
ncbi:MAG TPA: acyl-CoA dehydrogenase family protein [Steroidobacteraceae bacterium]|nr:acyl-CoA dehydrogenase family protein [Steroidobacteraceae bacterium]